MLHSVLSVIPLFLVAAAPIIFSRPSAEGTARQKETKTIKSKLEAKAVPTFVFLLDIFYGAPKGTWGKKKERKKENKQKKISCHHDYGSRALQKLIMLARDSISCAPDTYLARSR
ncbi:hypothetical protein GJAV_G00214410 [Gymnothorax javanicus]|nr:hypothetical protein GJAV_G00214410 [Gymnothorax javanicus]